MTWLQGLAASEPPTQPSAGRMPWEEESLTEPVEELPWETQVPAATQQNAPEAEPHASSDVSEWLKNLNLPEQPVASATPIAGESLPDWMNASQDAPAANDDLPDWLKDQSADEQPAAPGPAPTWVSDVQAAPAEPEPPKLIFSPPLEETPAPPPVEPPAPPAVPAGIPASTPIPTQPAPLTPVNPAVRQTGMLGDKDGPVLHNARQLMAHGSMESAISSYNKLIKRGKFIEEVIYDLKEATYTHPVDVIIWQTLGDAFMRANQLQEALDSYTKAEELLR
jgi:tetratricopeptide (TPR) repeat protein